MIADAHVTEEDMIELAKLSEQQKNQKAYKVGNRILKQTPDEGVAETFKPRTKKLGEAKESTKKSEKKAKSLILKTMHPLFFLYKFLN